MLRELIKDSAIYAIAGTISRGLAFLLLPLYTRVLSPADYGSLDLLLAFAAIVSVSIALEVSQGVARFYTAERDEQRKIIYASSAFWFTLSCYTVFGSAALWWASDIAELVMGQTGVETAFRIGVVYIWANGLFQLIHNQFRWERRSHHYAVVSIVMALVTAGVTVWLAVVWRWGLEGLLIGMVVGCLSGIAQGVWWLRTSIQFRFDGARLREMLAFSAPLVFSGIAVWVSLYIDRLMINHYLSITEVGLYGIGYRLASIAGLVMIGIQGALTPLIYSRYREKETPRHLARIFRMFLLLTLFVFLSVTLFASDILHLMVTESYYGGVVVVIYLVPAILLARMYIFAPGISIAKRTNLIVWINVGGAVINTCLNVVLIPVFGIVGAGLATLIGYAAVFVGYMFFSQRFYRVPHNWKQLTGAVVVAAMLGASVPSLASNEVVRWMLNVVALLLLLGMSIVFGLVRIDEVRQGLAEIRVRLRLAATN